MVKFKGIEALEVDNAIEDVATVLIEIVNYIDKVEDEEVRKEFDQKIYAVFNALNELQVFVCEN